MRRHNLAPVNRVVLSWKLGEQTFDDNTALPPSITLLVAGWRLLMSSICDCLAIVARQSISISYLARERN